jgi:osmotically-inducible protein OsmY
MAVTAPYVRGDRASMHVEVYDGVVVLGGSVEDPRARASIEGSVVRLPGVHALVQQLESAGLRTPELAPAEVAMKALRALRASPLPAGSHVTVVVDHGWLRLEGSVRSSVARDDIRRRMENISGARGFVDRITIAPDEIPATVLPGARLASATATRT